VSAVSLIPSLQSDALVREIEHQLREERSAIVAGAKRDAHTVVAQARAAARAQVHEAIEKLREEGDLRLTRAKAQLDMQKRVRAQQQAAKAVSDSLPLLRKALAERWRKVDARRQWTDAIARQCASRLRHGAWQVDHPPDWSEQEQKQFATAIGDESKVTFRPDKTIVCGLRVTADQAVLDATPEGLLADSATIAAMLLDEIERGKT
jgi:F0F1-type ATP synthase membrane subunit b/b'